MTRGELRYLLDCSKREVGIIFLIAFLAGGFANALGYRWPALVLGFGGMLGMASWIYRSMLGGKGR